jgi:acetyl-CoA carboxylase biotin carboxyl carrier protein
MEIKDIKSLIKMVTETDITEFELESAGEKLRIKRGAAPEVVHHYQASERMQASPQGALLQPQSAPVADSAGVTSSADKGQSITSPIVGTFYRTSSPDAPAYVEAGQIVEKGQILCIVEAMKLMNEIEAEFRCKILKICKENAQPVEYGETLFIVESL